MKLRSLFAIVTIVLVAATMLSINYGMRDGSSANIAGNLILLVCLFFFTWTVLLLSRAKYTNPAP